MKDSSCCYFGVLNDHKKSKYFRCNNFRLWCWFFFFWLREITKNKRINKPFKTQRNTILRQKKYKTCFDISVIQ